MKTLYDHTLIYDADCPLCRAYSGAFVTAGMLDDKGRIPFEGIKDFECVDRERAANEIALVDRNTGKTLYGVESLLAIIGSSFPMVQKIGKSWPLRWFLKHLYRFISYNRKVIMPSAKAPIATPQCVPAFNFSYRLLYIVISIVMTASVLSGYATLLPGIKTSGMATELLVAGLQVLFQGLFLWRSDLQTIINYSGNLLTVSLFGSLALLPVLIMSRYVPIPESLAQFYFVAIACLMFAEHLRRVRLLELPVILCVGWMVYRLLVLAILLP